MNRRMKQYAKLILGKYLLSIANRLRTAFLDKKGQRSHAQEGEDRVLWQLLFRLNGGKHKIDGFYVDVGAHHPYRYSNTCLFYQQGWQGINIDAMPGSMSAFRKQRPRDINLESGIGRTIETRKFYLFNEPALNTFDESLARSRCNDIWHIEATVDVPVVPLSTILKIHLPRGKKVDFFTVDVEGFDLDVLQSNDWQEYRPLVVLVETLGLSIEDLALDPVAGYMRSLGYVVYSKTVNTTFFVDNIAAQQGKAETFNKLATDLHKG